MTIGSSHLPGTGDGRLQVAATANANTSVSSQLEQAHQRRRLTLDRYLHLRLDGTRGNCNWK
jgi:hypothetical protein